MIHQLICPPSRDLGTAVLDSSRVVCRDAEDGLDESGLSTPIGTDDGDELALIYMYVDPI